MDDFLEGDDAFGESRSGGRRAAPRQRPERPDPRDSMEHRRQIMQRRLTAFGVGILIIILLVLGVRGCLDARKTRAFENYANDLTSLATESKQLANNFFKRLEDPGQTSDLSFEAETNADRGTAESHLERARALDPPGDLAGAHEDMVLAFELRRDGLAAIAGRLKTALGDQGANRAIRQIANDMRTFLASDVLYGRGQFAINGVLETEGIDLSVPSARFLPNDPDYLDRTTVEAALAGVAGGGGGGNVSGVHGMGLISTSIAGVALTPGTEATIASEAPELSVEVQNQGESTETDVAVSFRFSGGASIRGKETISSIEAGEQQTVVLPISPAPPSGALLELEVTVAEVPGEEVSENNTATYSVRFG